jgi:hypothetical protein
MRSAVLIVGVVAVLVGLLWIGQGTGTFPYPSTSFMIRQVEWAYIGGVVTLVGLVLIWRSRVR